MNRHLALCPYRPAARRPALAADAAPADALPRIKLEKVVKLDKPIEVRHDPAGGCSWSSRSAGCCCSRAGKAVEPAYLDLSDKVFVAFECGLLGIAFHPRFAENGLLYASYTTGTYPPAGAEPPIDPETKKPRKPAVQVKSYVSEFKVDPAARRVDPKGERVLLTLDQPFENHNGGQIEFGPDGMLYVGFGDGGSGHDPHGNGQKTDTWLGKILRIDVTPTPNGAGPGGEPHAARPAAAYTVPADNPFVGRDGWRPEIWALGQRNPWRFSFDRQTGLLYAADVGQDVWEEVNIITKGGNYGWRTREGAQDLHPESKASTQPLIDPIFAYNHDKKAASITGGHVYRGKKIPPSSAGTCAPTTRTARSTG
jgi:glucose/arabinose dehydrogenase